MKTVKKQLTLAALMLGCILSGAMMTGCNKSSAGHPDNSIRHTGTAQARIFMPGGSNPGGLWYFGTPFPGGCTTPCGNFCHAEPMSGTIDNGEGQEYGPAYYWLTDAGQFIVEVDMTNVNPQHLDEIVASGSFNVPVASELPYQSVVQAYNNAGITSNIPHYKMPQGPHEVSLNNTGTNIKVLTVTFLSPDIIDVSLEY